MDNNNTGNQTETTVYGVWVLRAYDSGIGSGIKITSQLSIPDHPVAKPELEHQLAPKYPQRAGGSPGGFKDTNATHRASKKQTCIQKRATYGLRRSVCSKVGAFDSERLETLRWSPWAPQSGGGSKDTQSAQRDVTTPGSYLGSGNYKEFGTPRPHQHPQQIGAQKTLCSKHVALNEFVFKRQCAQEPAINELLVQKIWFKTQCAQRTPRMTKENAQFIRPLPTPYGHTSKSTRCANHCNTMQHIALS